VNVDVAGGGSGSGLFDTSGRLLGVLSNGAGCGVSYSSGALMLDDPIDIPDPPTERAVMLGVLPDIGPGGRTSIGDGLAAARNQLNTTSGCPARSVC
jgi:hypothetical protein